jgi:hypothetical protein
VNTSSVNGFWATLGPGIPHTAYSTAKFAVKGFTEALIEDLRTNAPQVRVAVVMPGHVGTDIVANSMRVRGLLPVGEQLTEDQRTLQTELIRRGALPEGASADELRQVLEKMNSDFPDQRAARRGRGGHHHPGRSALGSLADPGRPGRRGPRRVRPRQAGSRLRLCPAGQHGAERPPAGRASAPIAGLAGKPGCAGPRPGATVTGMQRADMTTTPEPFPAR